jgi:hypothetical protein
MARPRFVELELPDALGVPHRVLSAVVPVLRPAGPRQLKMEMPTGAAGGRAARATRSAPTPPGPRTLPLF